MDAVIACELCGAQARLLCFCRKCSLCEGCVGKHLLSEPHLGHKPVTFSQSEIAALCETEFSQIREHENRLITEVTQRHASLKAHKTRLWEEIGKLEQFKSTCLECVEKAVETGKRKLEEAGETVGKEMVKQCEEKKRELEEALRTMENGGKHWVAQVLERDKEKAEIWHGKVDMRDIAFEKVLKSGIDFELSLRTEEFAPSKPIETKPIEDFNKRRASPQKSNRRISARPEPSTPTAKSSLPKPETPKSGRTTLRASSKKPSIDTSEPIHRSLTMKTPIVTVDEEPVLSRKSSYYHSPEPQLGRSLPFSPRSAIQPQFGFGKRAALLQQTARNVDEVSDMVKAMKSTREFEGSQPPKSRTSLAFGDLSPGLFDPPTPKTARSSLKPHLLDELAEKGKAVQFAFPEAIPEEEKPGKVRLYSPRPGTSQMLIRDIEAGITTMKTFEGIEDFPKLTYWCSNALGEVFILGGVTSETQPSTIKRSCLIYSPTNDTMEVGPNLTLSRYSCSAICLKDSIYVTGGIGTEMAALKDCEKLDLRSRKWRKISNMSIARESHGITLHASRLYVAGGPSEQSMETYNPVNDRWALLHFKVSASGKACMVSMGDKVAILHEKNLTFAWVERRTSENVMELGEKGWWCGGPALKLGDFCYLLRAGALFTLDFALLQVTKSDISAF